MAELQETPMKQEERVRNSLPPNEELSEATTDEEGGDSPQNQLQQGQHEGTCVVDSQACSDQQHDRDVSPAKLKTPKPGKKLGTIGGRRSNAETSDKSGSPESKEKHRDENPAQSTCESRRKRGKLGTIGRRKTKHPDESAERASEHEPSVSKVSRKESPPHDGKASSQPAESTQDKADRKREELKRQLDAKSKTQTKKKRKF